jgi:UDP-glucose 4-epimerase
MTTSRSPGRAIVTGGLGFIGRHVVQALRDRGHEVTVVDIADAERSIDICDTPALIERFREARPRHVFHLAAVADARRALADPVRTVAVNVGGTASVLEAARQAGAERVIVASSCWVANAMAPGDLDETAPFLAEGGGHVYTTTKIASEHLVHDFRRLYGLAFTILRYGIPYGPGMWPGLVLRNFLDSAFAGRPLTIFGDGSAARRFVHVKDLARAHVLALREAATDQVYNLEGRRPATIRELAELVSKHVGGVEIDYRQEPSRIGEVRYVGKVISSRKACLELEWTPEVDLEEGVLRTIEWYRRARRGMAA